MGTKSKWDEEQVGRRANGTNLKRLQMGMKKQNNQFKMRKINP